MRENLLAVRLPYFSGDYWPGFMDEAISALCDEEAKVDEDMNDTEDQVLVGHASWISASDGLATAAPNKCTA